MIELLLQLAAGANVLAQTPTSDPAAWRPLSYADLTHRSPALATYVDIWRDVLEDPQRGAGDSDTSSASPTLEAHFVIWSRNKSVVLSILNASGVCEVKAAHSERALAVKLCPMRLVFYEGIRARVMDAGRGCFPEMTDVKGQFRPADGAGSYGSYDIASKTLRIGVIVAGKAVDDCSQNIPFYPRQE